jgi:hypothetical protein
MHARRVCQNAPAPPCNACAAARPGRPARFEETTMTMRPWMRPQVGITVLLLALAPAIPAAQDKPYSEGSVWTVSFIRVKPGMFDVYMRELLPMRKRINEEAMKQGLLLSSRVLSGSASGKDDFDVMFLDEYKNWAAFDGLAAKYDAIMSKVVGSDDKQVQLMTKRSEVREIIGDKVMQELVIK